MANPSSQHAEIALNKELSILAVKFLNFTPHEEFRKIVEYEFELIKQYQIKKMLIDLRLLPVYASGTKEYVKDIWFPTVKKLGLRYTAFIVPEATLAQMAMNKAHDISDDTNALKINHFKDSGTAKEWLKSQY